jgi:hypothetical protein
MEGSCFGATCGTLTSQSYTEANKCSVKKSVPEESVDGCKYTMEQLILGVLLTRFIRDGSNSRTDEYIHKALASGTYVLIILMSISPERLQVEYL